jgi:hypothetical protein
LAELRAEMRLDSTLRFTDLWNTVGYRWLFTLWTAPTRASFWRARRHYAEVDWGPQPGHVVDLGDRGASVRVLLTSLRDNPRGSWGAFEQACRGNFPEPTRRRTLMLVMWHNPLYLKELSPHEQVQYARGSRTTLQRLRKLGFAALEGGKDFQPADYADQLHLVATGGAKLAAAVAPAVRALARRLGYEKEPRGGRP